MKYPNPNTIFRPTDQYQPGKSWFYEYDEFPTWIQTPQSTLQTELAITAALQYAGGFVTESHHNVPTDSCPDTDPTIDAWHAWNYFSKGNLFSLRYSTSN